MEIPETGCREEFKELANIIMEEDELQHPVTPEDGVLLYAHLLDKITNLAQEHI